jgi:hypothetical protein
MSQKIYKNKGEKDGGKRKGDKKNKHKEVVGGCNKN